MATRGRETYIAEQNRITLASVTVLRGGGGAYAPPNCTGRGGSWPGLVSFPDHIFCARRKK